MIQIYHLYKRYGSSEYVLNDINLTVKQGEWVVLRGREKTGKTTLLRLLYGVDQPTSGEMIVCGHNLSCIKKEKFFLYRRQLGIILQDMNLLNDRDLFANIDLVLRFCGFSSKVRKARIFEVLSLAGLERKINIAAGRLSEFEKRKLVIARAVVNNPRIILADGLDTGLSLPEQEEVFQIFKRLKKQDVTVFFSTKEESGILRGTREIELAGSRIREIN